MRRAVQISLLVAFVLPVLTATQERSGPPPEIRTLIDGFLKAVNSGSADQFEAMAKSHFSPAYLSRQTAADRARLLSEIRKHFGTVAMERVVREGPEEPLEINVKGSTGTSGVIRLSLDPASPFKVSDVGIDAGARNDAGRAGRGGRPVVPVDPAMSDAELSRALEDYLSPFAARDELSGAVLVGRDGQAVFQKAYGYADRANRIANTPVTRFNVGSINKKFTEIAVAQLTAAGKLDAARTLGDLIPDYPQAMSKPASVAQLLGHTAGIADFFGDEFARTSKDRFRSNADYFTFVSRLPALFAPGARNQYCNGCYIVLGAIIERITGVPYERYVAEHVFAPAGMTNTGYPQSDAIEPGVAIGYSRRLGGGSLRSSIFAHGASGSAAGGGFSTVGDLLAFDAAIRDGRLPGGRRGGMGIAGGAPGTNAVLESNGRWTVVVLTNLDPPFGENLGVGIMAALARGRE